MIARCPKCGAEMEGDVAIGDFVECPSCNGTFTLEKKDVATQMGTVQQMDKAPEGDKTTGNTRKKGLRIPPSVRNALTTATTSIRRQVLRLPQFAQGALATALVFTVGILVFSHCPNKGGDAGNQTQANEIGNIPSTASEPPVKTASAPPASAKNTVQTQKTEIDPGAELYKEAMRYYNGDDVLQDYNKAVELLIQASEKGSAEADGKLAAIYHDGVAGQSKDIAKAVSYAKKSGKKKTQLAHMVLGLVNFFGAKDVQTQNFEAAYSEFSNAPDYYNCLFYLGLMRYHGVGTKEDKKGAAEAFFSACRSKPDSQFAGFSALCLGYMYTEGEGVGRNIKEGDSWLMWGFKASGRVKLVAYDNWNGDERALVRHYEIRKQVIDGSTATRGLRRKYYETQELLRWSDVWPGGMDLVEKAIGRYWVTLETHY